MPSDRPRDALWGWVLVVLLGPPACFIYGRQGDAAGFAFTWAMVALCSAGLALWGRPGADGRPRVQLRKKEFNVAPNREGADQ